MALVLAAASDTLASAQIGGGRVKRRELITLLGGVAFSLPRAVRAQQAAVPVIGYMSGRSPDAEESMRTPILAALEEAGFVVGRARGAPAAVGRRFGSSAADAVRVDEECDQARFSA